MVTKDGSLTMRFTYKPISKEKGVSYPPKSPGHEDTLLVKQGNLIMK